MSAIERLPPRRDPPHDPMSFVLSGSIGPTPTEGFRAVGLDDVRLVPGDGCACLTLAPGVAARRSWDDPFGTFGGLELPMNVAVATGGEIYLLDRTRGLLKRFDRCRCAFEVVTCRGPEDAFAGATAIAVCGEDLFVANPQRGAVLRFALFGLVQLEAWTVPRRGEKALATGQRWRPVDLAFDGNGSLWVADSANGRIDRFGARGEWRDGWTGLHAPRAIAIDCEDRVYVLGAGREDDVTSFDAGVLRPVSREPLDLTGAFGRIDIPLDSLGHLHIGALCSDLCGRTGIFDLQGEEVASDDAPKFPLYAKEGRYTSGALDSEIERCVWHRVRLVGLVPENASIEVQTTTAQTQLTDDEVRQLPDGRWQTRAIWSGQRPARVERPDCVPAPAGHVPDGNEWDCLIRSAPGRFGWIRLILRGDGSAAPSVWRMIVEYPRISLRRYLPAVFGADPASADFTDRFLAVFDTTLRSIELHLDNQVHLFSPDSAPAQRRPGEATDFLSWIASWTGVTLDRRWPESRRRAFLASAARLLGLRGTVAGLRGALLAYLGMDRPVCCQRPKRLRQCVPRPFNCAPCDPSGCEYERPPLILEHFRLRRWLNVGKGRLGDESVLWGRSIVNRTQLGTNAQPGVTRLLSVPDPARDPFLVHAHRYTAFVPARVRESAEERRGLQRLLLAETPAHVQFDVRYVEPRFRVGVQAMIGYDSVIARTPQGVRLGDAELRRATVLSAASRGARRAGVTSVGTRLG